MERRNVTPLKALLGLCAGLAMAQQPPALTLRQAETMALQSHPRIQAAQYEGAYLNQQIIETRSAYYPLVTGEITGSEANTAARIGAGFLTDSRLFDRFGD
jgi:outer membrane protein